MDTTSQHGRALLVAMHALAPSENSRRVETGETSGRDPAVPLRGPARGRPTGPGRSGGDARPGAGRVRQGARPRQRHPKSRAGRDRRRVGRFGAREFRVATPAFPPRSRTPGPSRTRSPSAKIVARRKAGPSSASTPTRRSGGSAGIGEARPGLSATLAAVEAGGVGQVLAERTDRIARTRATPTPSGSGSGLPALACSPPPRARPTTSRALSRD